MSKIDKPLTLKMIILGLQTHQEDKARDVTGKEVANNVGGHTNNICDPYTLSLFANGKSEINNETFDRIIEATNSSARICYK